MKKIARYSQIAITAFGVATLVAVSVKGIIVGGDKFIVALLLFGAGVMLNLFVSTIKR